MSARSRSNCSRRIKNTNCNSIFITIYFLLSLALTSNLGKSIIAVAASVKAKGASYEITEIGSNAEASVVGGTNCKDTNEEFEVHNEEQGKVTTQKITCWDAIHSDPILCSRQVVQQKCPFACNRCCEDSISEFESIYPDLDFSTAKNCSMVKTNPELCYKDKIWRDKCQLSCKTCSCKSNDVFFQRRDNGMMQSCAKVITNPRRCNIETFQQNCPTLCDTCDIVFPPSEVEQNYNSTCEIDAKLSFPSIDEAPYYGYHSD